VEANPVGLWPLQQHPSWLLLVPTGWIVVFGLGIVLLPMTLARPLAFAVQVGHSLGAATWLMRIGAVGWLTAVALLACSGLVLTWTWKRAERNALATFPTIESQQ
jgi:hypothetical protein